MSRLLRFGEPFSKEANGPYDFPTNHSAARNPHIEPIIGDSWGEHLNDLPVRIINEKVNRHVLATLAVLLLGVYTKKRKH